jgi:cell division protein ZapE
MRQLAGSDTWFDAAGADTAARMDALFGRMAGGSQSAGPVVLRIQSRPLPALRTASGMAWFDFDVLCGGPRSAHDYIALSEEMHTLFLSGIPVMGPDQDDAARRLISLVDELYDRRVNLVASAFAAPAGLYRGERLRNAFQRTVSRLVEMRGGEYLSAGHQASRERA